MFIFFFILKYHYKYRLERKCNDKSCKSHHTFLKMNRMQVTLSNELHPTLHNEFLLYSNLLTSPYRMNVT